MDRIWTGYGVRPEQVHAGMVCRGTKTGQDVAGRGTRTGQDVAGRGVMNTRGRDEYKGEWHAQHAPRSHAPPHMRLGRFGCDEALTLTLTVTTLQMSHGQP